MSTDRPVVSVLMPVKDGIPYLEDAVRSVLGQTLRNFELIIVNDGSTDATSEVLACLAAEDARIRVLTLETNMGSAAASNHALDVAHGEFAARFDADDIADSKWLETEVAYLRAHPDIDIVGASRRFIRHNGILIKESPKSEGPFQVNWIAQFRWPFVHSTILFRLDRGPGKPAPRYDAAYRITQDYDFCVRYLADSKGANLPNLLVSYRVHDASISKSSWADQQRFARRVAEPFQEHVLPAGVFAKLAAFRDAYYDLKPRPARQIIEGLNAAIEHEMPAAEQYRSWMCREAAVLYFLTLRRTGTKTVGATAVALRYAPGLLFRAAWSEFTNRLFGV